MNIFTFKISILHLEKHVRICRFPKKNTERNIDVYLVTKLEES